MVEYELGGEPDDEAGEGEVYVVLMSCAERAEDGVMGVEETEAPADEKYS
jgi:hypothetical protein